MRAPTRLSGVLVGHLSRTARRSGRLRAPTAKSLPISCLGLLRRAFLGQIRHQEKGKPGVDPAGHLHSRSGLAAGLVLAIAAMGLEDFWDGRSRVDDHGRVPPATFATAIFSPGGSCVIHEARFTNVVWQGARTQSGDLPTYVFLL